MGHMSLAPHDIVPQAGQAAREAGASSAPARLFAGREDAPPSAPRHLTVPFAAVGRAIALPPLSGGMSEAIPPEDRVGFARQGSPSGTGI
jgi:hypothetical protein